MSWRGRRVLITSGPTREHLDPVRFLTNSSSGRMGWALAREARRQGARVTVVSGPVELPPPAGVAVVPVVSALEMLRETLRRAGKADLVIAAAAVSDWRFAKTSTHKIKRKPGAVRLTLTPNPDIIKSVGRRRRRGQVLVGFALETRDLVASARRKLADKGLDLVVANAASTLGSRSSVFHIVGKDAVTTVRGSKDRAARSILKAAHEKRAS